MKTAQIAAIATVLLLIGFTATNAADQMNKIAVQPGSLAPRQGPAGGADLRQERRANERAAAKAQCRGANA